MTQRFAAHSFNPMAFARAAGHSAGTDPLASFARVREELAVVPLDGASVQWSADGEARVDAAGQEQVWLHLQVRATLALVCQRCLGPVDVELETRRSFRFVADEATAQAEDDGAEEDVLALEADLDLHQLIEDELVLEMPLVPRHAVCPVEVKLSVADPEFAAAQEKPHPFAVLAGLAGDKSG